MTWPSSSFWTGTAQHDSLTMEKATDANLDLNLASGRA